MPNELLYSQHLYKVCVLWKLLSLQCDTKTWINVMSWWWTEKAEDIEWQEWLTDEHWWRREEMRDTRHVPVHQCSEEMKNMTLWIRDYISIYNCFLYTVVV